MKLPLTESQLELHTRYAYLGIKKEYDEAGDIYSKIAVTKKAIQFGFKDLSDVFEMDMQTLNVLDSKKIAQLIHHSL